MFLSILIILIGGLVGIGIRVVPTNTQWIPVLFGQRLPIRFDEGLIWLPRWLFTYIEESTIERRIEVLVKKRDYTQPDDSAPTHEAPHQTVETILVPDGNGEGAVFVHVSNVSVQFHIIKHESGWPDGWWKIFRFIGWKRGNLLLAYTSIARAEVDKRIVDAVLRYLRQVIGDYPYQKIVHLNVKMNGELVSPEERGRVRREIDQRILEEINKNIAVWGIEATAVPIGDIDPDPVIIQELQALSAATLHKQRVAIDMSAIVTKVNLMFEATSTKPTHEQWMLAYAMEVGLSNQGKAADHGLFASQFFEQLRGVMSPIVNITVPGSPPPTSTEKVA
ncbi:MAG: SPFH domain-containing protein [Patescibacteria group bacterium]